MKQNYHHIKNAKTGWTKIPNAIRHDEKLTSDAKVVIEELLSVSGNYHISESGLASSLHLSIERVKKAVRLLKSAGYIQITKVKDGSRFGGYEWEISDIGGTFQETENRAFGNQAFGIPTDGKPSVRKIERTELQQTENPPIYEYTERYEGQNNERRIDELTEEDEETKSESSTPFLTPLNQQSESIISSGELNTIQAFNRFCEVYPRLGDRAQAQAAFFAIPDINNICWQITNSVEWFEKLKRWDDWQTGQKNVSCPQAVKFLKRGDWQEYLKSGATKSRREELDEILPDEEDEYETNQQNI